MLRPKGNDDARGSLHRRQIDESLAPMFFPTFPLDISVKICCGCVLLWRLVVTSFTGLFLIIASNNRALRDIGGTKVKRTTQKAKASPFSFRRIEPIILERGFSALWITSNIIEIPL